MKKYIIIFEDGTNYIADDYSDNDLIALCDGVLSIIRISDCKELTLKNEWIELEKWVNG